MAKLFIEDLELAGKRVLMRVDFNVPVKDGTVENDRRLRASLPSIRYVLSQGASLVLMSHLGRPDGQRIGKYSLGPVAERFQELLHARVRFLPDCVGPDLEKACGALKPGEVVVLENLRFHIEEEGKVKSEDGRSVKADPGAVAAFRASLTRLGDVYVNDAFGTAHRAHSSIVGVNLPQRAAGYLMRKELDFLGEAVNRPKRPFVAIIGGAKVSGKIDVIESLLPKVDTLLIGGGMTFTFFKAQGKEIGASLVENDRLEMAQALLAKAGSKLMLPVDIVVTDVFENIMWEQGYLDAKQMAGAFQLLRSNDLIWSTMVREYLLGQRPPMTDLMAWNADATRMPYRMHSAYLRDLFLNNDLADGHYAVGGRPITVRDIRVPIFAVGTVWDHVAPWRSVYKIHLLSDTDVTFVLANGGHNAGIVSEPGHPGRHYQIATRRANDKYLDPEIWQATAPQHEGSWWWRGRPGWRLVRAAPFRLRTSARRSAAIRRSRMRRAPTCSRSSIAGHVMDYVETRTFDEIKIGDSARLARTLTRDDISLFAVMSGDVNPAHVDEEYAKTDMFHKIIAHGMWGGALISTLLGTKLPGPGTIYLGQTLRFSRPVALGDTITVSVKAAAKEEQKHRVTFECECVNQRGEVVIKGDAEVIAPTEKVKRPREILPEVRLQDGGARYRQLIDLTKGLAPIRTAVVHPVDRHSLLGALDAAQANLIVPILVGPEAKIRAAAEAPDVDLRPYTLIATAHSHQAAATAVAMARAGKVEALMKGSLHTDEIMHEAVARDTGLGTERRVSHVYVMDVPTYPRPLFITDAAINIAPGLDDKRDIVQNAIDLARVLGVDGPRVAVLSAVETCHAEASVHARCRCPVQDGRPRADHRRRRRGRVPRVRQRRLGGGRADEIDRLPGGRQGGHSPRGRPRGWKHAGQAAGVPGRGSGRGNRAGRAHPDHPDQPRGHDPGAHGVLRSGSYRGAPRGSTSAMTNVSRVLKEGRRPWSPDAPTDGRRA